ncbi:hypothetical protein LJR066_000608 [Acidovorax sp. LjRoot66]|uniref:hypothetical protein n=1 Tax=Acidovorax sp. LjRoot66 TaxID=3342334 RepID=UPI003ECF40E5
MLPDLPEFKGTFSAALVRYVSKRAQAQLGVFAEVPRQILHEGHATRIARANGDIEDSPLFDAGAQATISEDDMARLSREERLELLNFIADKLAEDMAGKLYGALSKTLDRAGQTLDNRGKPFNAETIFALFERLEIDFDRHGQPNYPTLSLAPELQESAKQAFAQIETDPKLRERFANMIGEKKAKWRDREAARKLVG